MTPHHQPQERSWLRSLSGLVLLTFLAIAAFFLIAEHRGARSPGALPYVLFLVCPILHLLMHGRHGSACRPRGEPGSTAARRCVMHADTPAYGLGRW